MLKFTKITKELVKIDEDNAKADGLDPIYPIIAKFLNKDTLDLNIVCSEEETYVEYEKFEARLGFIEYKKADIGTGFDEESEIIIDGEKGVLIADHGCKIWFK